MEKIGLLRLIMEQREMRFIGDVHGKFDDYVSIISNCTESIQVGDFGAGFKPLPTIIGQTGLFETSRHKFIRGNHDNPAICQESHNWIADGDVRTIGNFTAMLIGGALSIDRDNRIEGVSWWRDEENTMDAMYKFMDTYEATKPDIMITHDCPETIAAKLFNNRIGGKIDYPSRTRQAFEAFFGIHQPKVWIFGHWHMSRDQMIDGTRFICLAELEYRDMEL
jgi:hypothetical protein